MDRRTRAGESERPASRRASPPVAATTRPAPQSPLDQALAEIAERQRILDGENARSALPRAPSQGLGGLEQQLRNITAQIESLKPGAINAAVDTLRDDLAEIGHLIREAMPRHAIEALETEVRSLAQRIDNKRDAGANSADLAGIEHALLEVRDALRGFTPAESLIGVESAVRAMGQKIDRIAAVAKDPTALEHLEDAIVGLRSVVSHVASNDALARLTNEVRALGAKVEQVASSDILATLEQRISFIADALQSRPQIDRDMQDLEAVVQRLVEKIERLQLLSAEYPNSQLEEHIAKLIEKIEFLRRPFQPARQDRARACRTAAADRPPTLGAAGGDRYPQTRRPAHPALDRGRARQTWAGCQSAEQHRDRPAWRGGATGSKRAALRARSARCADAPSAGRPRWQHRRRRSPAHTSPAPTNPANSAYSSSTYANPARPTGWAPLETDLPPDYPIEPNHRSSPAERIAASQAALGNPLGTARTSGHPDADAKANFIAAARRAAQAASGQLTERADRRVPELRRVHGDDGIPSNVLGNHARLLLVAASVVMVVLGSLQLFGFFSSPNRPGCGRPRRADPEHRQHSPGNRA